MSIRVICHLNNKHINSIYFLLHLQSNTNLLILSGTCISIKSALLILFALKLKVTNSTKNICSNELLMVFFSTSDWSLYEIPCCRCGSIHRLINSCNLTLKRQWVLASTSLFVKKTFSNFDRLHLSEFYHQIFQEYRHPYSTLDLLKIMFEKCRRYRLISLAPIEVYQTYWCVHWKDWKLI